MFSEPLRDVNRKQPPQRVDTQYVAIASRPQDGSVESELGSLHFPGALPFSFISLTLFGQRFFSRLESTFGHYLDSRVRNCDNIFPPSHHLRHVTSQDRVDSFW